MHCYMHLLRYQVISSHRQFNSHFIFFINSFNAMVANLKAPLVTSYFCVRGYVPHQRLGNILFFCLIKSKLSMLSNMYIKYNKYLRNDRNCWEFFISNACLEAHTVFHVIFYCLHPLSDKTSILLVKALWVHSRQMEYSKKKTKSLRAQKKLNSSLLFVPVSLKYCLLWASISLLFYCFSQEMPCLIS